MSDERAQKQRLLGFARDMRSAPSDAEHKLWQSLRAKRLDGIKFKRQHPIPPYIADFAADEHQLVVEVDGEQHNDQQEYDERRTTDGVPAVLRLARDPVFGTRCD